MTDVADVSRRDVASLFVKDHCRNCTNELCIDPDQYRVYKEAVSVDTYEMVLIGVHTLIFLSGIIGNFLVSFEKLNSVVSTLQHYTWNQAPCSRKLPSWKFLTGTFWFNWKFVVIFRPSTESAQLPIPTIRHSELLS